MLIFGPYRACLGCIRPNENSVMLNFTSFNENIPRLSYLLPQVQEGITREEFEMRFCQYIELNQFAFSNLMNIMIPLYEGRDVFVCTSGDCFNEYLTMMNDILPWYIRERYGYNSAIINEPDDLLAFDQADFHFTVQGILLLDQDRERLTQMMERERIRAGGRPYAEQ